MGAVPGSSAACGAVLLSQQGYRSPALICMKRMSFAWLLEKRALRLVSEGGFFSTLRAECVSVWHTNNPQEFPSGSAVDSAVLCSAQQLMWSLFERAQFSLLPGIQMLPWGLLRGTDR